MPLTRIPFNEFSVGFRVSASHDVRACVDGSKFGRVWCHPEIGSPIQTAKYTVILMDPKGTLML